MAERLIRLSEVERLVGLRRSAIYERVRLGMFPRPVKLGRSSAWVGAEVEAWIDAQIQASRGEVPRR